MNAQYGLSVESISKIKEVFARYPAVDKAVLYGSRAKGTERPGSDIDLVLFGSELDQAKLDKILSDLDDLLLPYQTDVSIFSRISHPDLLDHISRIGVTFYDKTALGITDRKN